jgi:hypothetical protein
VTSVFGVEVPDLDADFGQPVDVLCVIKCLKPEGDTSSDGYPYRLVVRSSRISTWEAFGMAAYVQEVAFDEDLYGGEPEA